MEKLVLLATGRTDSANLTALAMADPDQGWAAGFVLPNDPAEGGFELLLASWNGRRWSVVRVDTGSASGRLDGLAGASPDDAWAVGTAFSGRGVARPLILRWNGRRWTLPDVAPFRQAGLSSVAIAPDGRAWAVGVPFDNSRRPLVLRWTGQAWTLAVTPASSGDVMAEGVTALGDSDVWAVGTISSGSGGALHAYAAHWNGRAWSVRGGPMSRADADLSAVAFDGRRTIWTVGTTSPSPQTFVPLVQVRKL
jgi:hypothetical protein